MAMNKSFHRTQDLMQSVQRQVKTLIDRKDGYNMRTLQEWNTFRWSRNTSLSDPAANLIRMKACAFSDSTLCVGVSNSNPSNNWATKLEDVCDEHGFVEQFNLAARAVQFIWHTLPSATTIGIKRHIQDYLNGQNPESFAKEVAAFATIFLTKTLMLPWAPVRKYVVECKVQRAG